ncbi:MAG: hypothetical protein K2X81_03965 [Candidatus Obscuribacterales bacterium]|nr:hypothetical protein [Candidatus Obscuribacterales bacterium]
MHTAIRVFVGASVCLLFACFCSASYAADAAKEDMVEVISATKMTKAELAALEETHRTLLSNQDLIKKVLTHEGVEYYTPKLPQYRVLGANSLLSFTDQFYYAALAKKLGVGMPEGFNEPAGSSALNNRYIHLYNNEILRCIAKKLSLDVPAKVANSDDHLLFSSKVIAQNHEILGTIAKKLGVKS